MTPFTITDPVEMHLLRSALLRYRHTLAADLEESNDSRETARLQEWSEINAALEKRIAEIVGY
jgi:hypothetical protein